MDTRLLLFVLCVQHQGFSARPCRASSAMVVAQQQMVHPNIFEASKPLLEPAHILLIRICVSSQDLSRQKGIEHENTQLVGLQWDAHAGTVQDASPTRLGQSSGKSRALVQPRPPWPPCAYWSTAPALRATSTTSKTTAEGREHGRIFIQERHTSEVIARKIISNSARSVEPGLCGTLGRRHDHGAKLPRSGSKTDASPARPAARMYILCPSSPSVIMRSPGSKETCPNSTRIQHSVTTCRS